LFVLASASPRRRELLEQIDCSFHCVASDAAEEKRQDISPQELVVVNALLKARAVADMPQSQKLPVLGADTVVSFEGKIFGKPANREEAKNMLRALSGKSHEVCTGIAFIQGNKEWSDAVTTKVRFSQLTEADIDAYVNSGEPDDKAGAYAIQGKAAAFIEAIEGCYTNVVGLPLQRLKKLAEKAGIELK